MARDARLRSLVFCPAFNQVLELPRLLEELKAAPLPCDDFVFINNGSSDGTAELIHASGFRYIDLPRNRGVGRAIMVALDDAFERGFDILGGLAANGKMLPSELGRVLDPILEGRADYVTGSRFLEGGGSPNLPSFRQNAIPMVNVFVRVVTGARLTDATCGYRAYRLDILRRARFDWHAPELETYGLEYYLYAKYLLGGFRCLEVPITMRYPPRGTRYSKIRPGRDWWAMLKPWLSARLDGKGFDPA